MKKNLLLTPLITLIIVTIIASIGIVNAKEISTRDYREINLSLSRDLSNKNIELRISGGGLLEEKKVFFSFNKNISLLIPIGYWKIEVIVFDYINEDIIPLYISEVNIEVKENKTIKIDLIPVGKIIVNTSQGKPSRIEITCDGEKRIVNGNEAIIPSEKDCIVSVSKGKLYGKKIVRINTGEEKIVSIKLREKKELDKPLVVYVIGVIIAVIVLILRISEKNVYRKKK